VNLHAAWSNVGRSKYLPHMGNRERARVGASPAFPRLAFTTAWVGEPADTRQLERAKARAEAKAERGNQKFAARHAKRIGRRKLKEAA